jgi:hypothetical protein
MVPPTAKVTRTKAGRRKCRLFACGCCRLIWEHLSNPSCRKGVDVAERHADGLASGEELALARERIGDLWYGSYVSGSPGVQERTAASMAHAATDKRPFEAAFYMTAIPVPLAGYRGDQVVGEGVLCDLLRCVFGNPFRPPAVDRTLLSWNGAAIPRLAQAVYEERITPGSTFDPALLTVLADALEDASGSDPTIVSHLRTPGPHVRGCWAVDLMLGKR